MRKLLPLLCVGLFGQLLFYIFCVSSLPDIAQSSNGTAATLKDTDTATHIAKHVDTATHTHASTDCSNCNCKASAAFVYNYKNCLQPWQSARRVAYLCCPLSFFFSSSSSHCLHMFNYSPSHSFAVAAETVRAIRLIDRLTHRG